MQATLLFSANALLGEGPVWLPRRQRLLWLDIDSLLLHSYDPEANTDETFSLPGPVGCVVPVYYETALPESQLLLAGPNGIEQVLLKETGGLESQHIWTHPEADNPNNRYNDGKCSPEGRFWFGSYNNLREPHQASLYVLDSGGCRVMISGATNSNGLAWSPGGETFYWIDTPTRCVSAFDYDKETGDISRPKANRRIVIRFPEENSPNPEGSPEGAAWGRPDGMTIDAEGMLWIAHWHGSRVTRWNPHTGELLDTVWLPVSRVTSVAFGGKELDTLFITTASKGMTPEEKEREPDAGGLFVVQPSVKGLPPDRFVLP